MYGQRKESERDREEGGGRQRKGGVERGDKEGGARERVKDVM